MAKHTCSIEGCDRQARARGWCSTHYCQWRRSDDSVAAPPLRVIGDSRGTMAERFKGKWVVDPLVGCWVWTAASNGRGYGRIWVDGRPHPAHRVAYEIHVGPIPAGMEIDHLCRNRGCVNPAHLEPVTRRENLRRARVSRHDG